MLNYQSLFGTSNIQSDSIQTNNITASTADVKDLTLTSATGLRPVVTDTRSILTTIDMPNGNLLIGNNNSYSVAPLTAGSNQVITNGTGSITVAVTPTPSFTTVTTTVLKTSGIYTVNNTFSVAEINAIIANPLYSYIYFATGTYTLTSALIVTRSFVTLDGSNGALLMLSGNVNQPCICIGQNNVNPATILYTNITVKGLMINGNNSNQDVEFWTPDHSWIPNSCISAMKIEHLTLDSLRLDESRSGGLTLVNLCNHVVVTNCSSFNNWFDAFTWYGSTNVFLNNCHGHGHTNGAGVSVDNGNSKFVITNCSFVNNKEAIFCRYADDCAISNNIIMNNTTQGIWMSGYGNTTADHGCSKFSITGNKISNNGSVGMYLQSCTSFTISGNTICNNTGDGIDIANDTPSNIAGACSNNVLCDNIISNNGAYGLYVNANNSSTYASGNILAYNVIKNNITGAINGDLTSFIRADGTTVQTELVAIRNGIHTCALYANPSGSSIFQFPQTNGTVDQLLRTDGSGNTSWQTVNVTTNTVTATSTTSVSTSNTTYTTSGFNCTITKRNASARVRISLSNQIGYYGTDFGVFSIMRTVRGISFDLSGGPGFATLVYNGDMPWSCTYMDVSTDSVPITYGIFYKCNASGSVTLNNSGIMTYIEATEIA